MTEKRKLRLLTGCTTWSKSWPAPSVAQARMLRDLRRYCWDAFVAAVDDAGVQRVVVLSRGRGGRQMAREYVLLRDGRMRRVQAGVPYELASAA